MALKAEDYARMGRERAQFELNRDGEDRGIPFARDKDYWGARAWWEAYDAEFQRLKTSAVLSTPKGQEALARQAESIERQVFDESAPISAKAWEGLDAPKPRTVLAKGAAWPYDKKTPRGSHIQQLQAQLVEDMPAGRRKRIEAAIVRVKLRDSIGR